MKCCNLIFLVLFLFLINCKNKRIIYKEYDNAGNLISIFAKDTTPDRFISIKYYSNGKVKSYITYQNNLIDGVFQYYDSTGKPIFIEEYKKNKKNGFSNYYYPNGFIKSKIEFENDLKQGMFIDYYENDSGKAKAIYNCLIVRDTSYLNSWQVMNSEGKIISQSPHLAFFMKESNLYIKVLHPKFNKARVVIGSFDHYFYLKDSLLLDTIVSNKDFVMKIPINKFENNKLIRGIVENYKIISQKKSGSYSTISKDIYFEYRW